MVNIHGLGTHREDFNNTESTVQKTRKMKLFTNEPQLLPVLRMEGPSPLQSNYMSLFLIESFLLFSVLNSLIPAKQKGMHFIVRDIYFHLITILAVILGRVGRNEILHGPLFSCGVRKWD